MDIDRIGSLVSDVIGMISDQEPIECRQSHEGSDSGPEDELCGLLMSNLDTPLDIGALCELIGADKYGISRRFSEIYGYTPYAFHKHHRLIRAAAEISLGGRSMQEVAVSIGYVTENKFADAFKRKFGCRPGQFASEDAHAGDRLRSSAMP